MKKYLIFVLFAIVTLNGFAQKRTFVYDEQQRLKITNYWQGGVIVSSVEYTYDEVGNRIVKDIAGQCPAPTATITGTQSINQGQSANLSVALTGAAPWTIVVNGQTYSNIISSPYQITVTPTTTTTYTISSITNKCGAGTVSGSAIVTVCIPATATITGTQTINNGQSANISVALTGTSPWAIVVNGQSYSNITTSPKVISVSPTTTTTYTVSSVSNPCGTGTTSGSATVSVCNPATATITGTQTINQGQSANLSVALTGDSPWSIVVNGQTYSNITTSPKVISVIPTATTTYTVSSVSNACGAGTASGSATVTVCIPAIATITGTQTINQGQSANISVALTGNSPWSIVVNGQTYSNITTSPKVISVTPTTTTTYTVSSVSNVCGVGTASGSATVTVCNPATASITGTQTIIQGQSANLSVALTGDSPWSIVVNGQTYSNITTSPKVISVTPTTTTTYTVSSVSNACGAGTASGSAVISVCIPATATITGTQTINQGQSANLSVALTGNSPYNFTVNGQNYSNISLNPYLITVTPTTTTTYSVSSVSNSCGAGTSNGSAIVTVNIPQGCDLYEPNNIIANAKLITGTTFDTPNLCFDVITDNDWFKWVYAGKTYYLLAHTFSHATTGNYKLSLNFTGTQLGIELKPTVTGENVDSYLTLYDSDGTTILGRNDDIGGSPWSYYSKITYDIPITCTDKPDLVIIDMPITEYKSNQLKYTVQIKNIGGSTANLGSVSYYSYTSPDALYNNGNDRFVNGLFIGGSLGAGQILNLNWQGEFKYDANYYLIGVIDYHSLLTECLETNNTFVKLANVCTGTNLTLSGLITSGYYSTNGYVQISGQATATGNVLVVGKAINGIPNFLGKNITLQTGSCLNPSNAPLSILTNYEKTIYDSKNPKSEIAQQSQQVNNRGINTLFVETINEQLEAVINLAVPQKISLSIWSEKDKKMISEPISSKDYEAGEYRISIDTTSWVKGQKYLIHLNKPNDLDITVVEW